MDTLAPYVLKQLEDMHLCDPDPIEMVPTSWNMRTWVEGVAKRLEKLIISEGLF
jgi:hypothetical protein